MNEKREERKRKRDEKMMIGPQNPCAINGVDGGISSSSSPNIHIIKFEGKRKK
jgi:hypothetical protein